MIKFDTTELNQSAYLLYLRHSYSSLRITEKQPHSVNYIQAPKLICYMIIFKLINKLQLEDFEFDISLKSKIINASKGQNKHLDLLQIASCIIIDSISVRDFGGHIEVINRLGAQPST